MKGLKYLCGLLLAAGLFTSCEKEITLTTYMFYFNEEEYTQPSQIADPEVRDFYLSIRESFAGMSYNDFWQVDVVNRNYGPEDDKARTQYDSKLTSMKKQEAQCRQRIEEFGVHEGSSFFIKYVYRLSRDVPADHFTAGYSPETLREYVFELRYN